MVLINFDTGNPLVPVIRSMMIPSQRMKKFYRYLKHIERTLSSFMLSVMKKMNSILEQELFRFQMICQLIQFVLQLLTLLLMSQQTMWM